ncbi:hypothetical protein [Streptomyces sp. H39-S7]|uniref:hypothetical protein n=1 Tax=Streptomyces sp. H39-S7 TaxID=3004357 RepID=UPI0022AF9E26|nr:hypothetical protein [Streptomyces sp. H39-S7]
MTLAYAVESYVTNAQNAMKLARATQRAGSAGISRLLGQPLPRLIITTIIAAMVIFVQFVMIRLAYIVGSIISSAFDPARRDRFAHLPADSFLEIESLSPYLHADLISVGFTAFAAFLMINAYRNSNSSRGLSYLLAAPCNIIAFGFLSMAALTLLIDALLLGVPFILSGGEFVNKSLSAEWITDPNGYVVAIACFIYTVTAVVSVEGARLVGRLFRETPA